MNQRRIASSICLVLISFFVTPQADARPKKSSSVSSSASSASSSTDTYSPIASGPRFWSPEGSVSPRWSAGLSFQSITGTKGFGIEGTTPSFIYGKAAVRASFHRNHFQGFNVNTLAQNPTSNLEQMNFNILSFNVLFPARSGLDALTPYYGGGINFVLVSGQVSDSSTQINFGLVAGANLRLLSQSSGSETPWALFTEFGYNTENVEANKIVGNPQIADGFIARGGARYFF